MNNRSLRKLHRILAPILFLPCLLTTVTGVIYRLGNSWFHMPKRYAQIMMSIHQGSFLGKDFVPIYILLNGVGMIGLLITGIVMSGMFRDRRESVSAPLER